MIEICRETPIDEAYDFGSLVGVEFLASRRRWDPVCRLVPIDHSAKLAARATCIAIVDRMAPFAFFGLPNGNHSRVSPGRLLRVSGQDRITVRIPRIVDYFYANIVSRSNSRLKALV